VDLRGKLEQNELTRSQFLHDQVVVGIGAKIQLDLIAGTRRAEDDALVHPLLRAHVDAQLDVGHLQITNERLVAREAGRAGVTARSPDVFVVDYFP
jgi:hypothetical protein